MFGVGFYFEAVDYPAPVRERPPYRIWYYAKTDGMDLGGPGKEGLEEAFSAVSPGLDRAALETRIQDLRTLVDLAELKGLDKKKFNLRVTFDLVEGFRIVVHGFEDDIIFVFLSADAFRRTLVQRYGIELPLK